VDFKQEPIYIVPSPRLVKTGQISNYAIVNIPETNTNAAVPLAVESQVSGFEKKVGNLAGKPINVMEDKVVEITTKKSSRYRDNSKKSDFS
jgi:hypothetical protein